MYALMMIEEWMDGVIALLELWKGSYVGRRFIARPRGRRRGPSETRNTGL
jgi:hypothetical protein